MIRLFQIEWLKLKYYKVFWILLGLYAVSVTAVCSSGMFFMAFLKKQGASFNGIDPTILPLYDFPDIWQNLTFMASFLKVILAFIVIISVANEANYRTLRQNIIDGMSKVDVLLSKLLIIFALALTSTLIVFLIGLVTGSIYSHVQGWDLLFQKTEFLLAYGFNIFTYLCFTLMIVLLIPKTGLVIVGLFLYTFILEPFTTFFILDFPHLKDWVRPIAYYFPVFSMFNLIHFPFKKYILMEIQDYIALKDFLIVLGWLIISIWMSYLLLRKKDW